MHINNSEETYRFSRPFNCLVNFCSDSEFESCNFLKWGGMYAPIRVRLKSSTSKYDTLTSGSRLSRLSRFCLFFIVSLWGWCIVISRFSLCYSLPFFLGIVFFLGILLRVSVRHTWRWVNFGYTLIGKLSYCSLDWGDSTPLPLGPQKSRPNP